MDKVGFKIQSNMWNLSFVSFNIFITPKDVLKVVLINKTNINPFIPYLGIKKVMALILTNISIMLNFKVENCKSRAFKLPSTILSKYIKGIKGAKILSKYPTSSLLYKLIPSSLEKQINIPVANMAIKRVNFTTLDII